MVLQDRYAKAASRRYARAHATELTDEDAALKQAVEEANKRRLGSNADRYREDDEQLAKERGESVGGAAGPAVPEEVDEEEEARKAAEQAELDDFRSRQREHLLQQPTKPEDEEDDEDVDHSFAHLRIGGAKGKGVVRSPGGDEVDEELKARQDEARRTQAVRDLKDRFSGGARPLPPPIPAATTASSSSSSRFTLPPKPGVKSTGKGQDFLDTLL
ncbi:hypothetical protein JCM11251_004383 [Rhodosporidiobolus azoricus]